MKRTILALLVGCLPFAVVAAPPITEPVDVVITNPVVPVEVSNANPVPVAGVVTSADNPALQPVTLAFSTEIQDAIAGPNFLNSTSIYTVPDGKRMVIEFVDASVYGTPWSNTGKAMVAVYSLHGANSFRHPLGVTAESIHCTLSQVCWFLNAPLKVYLDAGAQLYAQAVIDLTQPGDPGALLYLRGTVNGYLVDLP